MMILIFNKNDFLYNDLIEQKEGKKELKLVFWYTFIY